MEPSEYAPLPREAHEYIDGQLSAEAERDFERRLERDPALKQRLAEVQAARRMLQSVALCEVPAGFDEGVYERLKYVDLARSAREKLVSARPPLWQRALQVGAGALAASVVLALVGLPGLSGPGQAPLDSGPLDGAYTPLASITEADVLPLLADNYDRFSEMKRQVLFAPARDAETLRDLVRAELELSELPQRCRRLAAVARGLPEPERREYLRFFESVAACCEAMDAELVRSRNDRRQPDMQALGASLASVQVPARLAGEDALLVTRFGPSGRVAQGARVSVGNDSELALYLLAREACYQRDYESAARHYDDYLARFPRGRFSDSARAGSASALLRSGLSDRALDRYLADVRGNAAAMPLLDSSDAARLKQAELERARRTPPPQDK